MSGAAPARQPRTKPVVSVEAARVDLGGRPILSRVSFAIDDGELVAILGPNGAGKSTLLKLLLGLVRPVSGIVSVLGQPPAG
ncbi:MAG TPA: ATP-binding cassette domain-containing protein [Spirochaetia bacterium]|nr:ATP-binding cassette domain-containing protein [Spirochaetia bacterium]